jgi:hypothetical protein
MAYKYFLHFICASFWLFSYPFLKKCFASFLVVALRIITSLTFYKMFRVSIAPFYISFETCNYVGPYSLALLHPLCYH